MTADPASIAPVLVVDNHDSFVHTLVGYLHELGAATVMVEADQVSVDAVPRLVGEHAGILISPGPGRPADTAASQNLVREAVEREEAEERKRKEEAIIKKRIEILNFGIEFLDQILNFADF